MAKTDQKLEIRSISELQSKFRIPSYQRGYRWERSNVRQLLDDLLEHINDNKPGDPYYLQPIVVAPEVDEQSSSFDYDLIDGQQRLTTIFIILKALKGFQTNHQDKKKLNELDFTAHYTLTYATRTDSEYYLNNIDQDTIVWGIDGKEQSLKDIAATYPDFLYMWHAYQEAKDWVEYNEDELTKLGNVLLNDVKIIWYELNETVESWEKFTQLNVGKIPLTNSELVKALLLSDQHQEIDDYGRSIVVNQWDTVEKELGDKRFLGFLTTSSPQVPRIDFIFNLFAGKPKGNKDDFYTFQFFVDKLKNNPKLKGKALWDDIYSKYQRLRDWYNDSWYYHRIGYLVAVDRTGTALRSIFEFAYPDNENHKTKSEVRGEIDDRIRKSLQWSSLDRIWNLSYDDTESEEYKTKPGKPHNPKIINLLTLYNVMIYDRLNATYGIKYPFYSHNNVSGGWSLEHIHAQHSERLTHADQWVEWVKDHLDSLRRIRKFLNIDSCNDASIILSWNELDRDMSHFEAAPDGDKFDNLVVRFCRLTASSDPRTSGEYKDELTNLALLSRDGNSRLNNSTFDVKRVIVGENISTDFLPIGTERVFLKSISDTLKSTDTTNEIAYHCDIYHMYYWGEKDRTAYKYDIWNYLKDYLNPFNNPAIQVVSNSNSNEDGE